TRFQLARREKLVLRKLWIAILAQAISLHRLWGGFHPDLAPANEFDYAARGHWVQFPGGLVCVAAPRRGPPAAAILSRLVVVEREVFRVRMGAGRYESPCLGLLLLVLVPVLLGWSFSYR